MPGIDLPAAYGSYSPSLAAYAGGARGLTRSSQSNISQGGAADGASATEAKSGSGTALHGGETGASAKQATGAGSAKSVTGKPLTKEAEAELTRLKQRDQEVKTHEQAHQSAGGSFAGSATFTYQTGPDGTQYATGGEVSIDTSTKSDNAQATIAKMETIKRAALAPAQPSAQDYKVAETAALHEAEARTELATGGKDGEKDQDGGSGKGSGKGIDANGPESATSIAKPAPAPASAETKRAETSSAGIQAADNATGTAGESLTGTAAPTAPPVSTATQRGFDAYARAGALLARAQSGGSLAIAA